tara:strand:+ start:21486 stop:22193 length:708 start_codon:yes stop_codon:yes gene_type:complete
MYKVSGLEITPFKDIDQAVGAILDGEGHITPGFAIALNAEKIISMRRNNDVRRVLELATLRYPDGIGVVWALRRKGAECVRIPGCELWQELMKLAGQEQTKVFIVGAKPEVMDAAKEKLIREYNVNLVGAEHGYFEDEAKLIEQIVDSGAEIITVALGSPKQEKFIHKCRERHPNAFYMGVGGTYDVFVGNVQRAPDWMQRLNLEWFYRLLKQPTRISRQVVYLQYMLLLLTNRI